jgi:hypothetical protein
MAKPGMALLAKLRTDMEEQSAPKPEREIDNNGEEDMHEELVEQIEQLLNKVGQHEHLTGQSELIRLLQQVDVVIRQTYPGPVNPQSHYPDALNPQTYPGPVTIKCPHCGKNIP